MGLTSTRASYLKLLDFVQLKYRNGLAKAMFRAASGRPPVLRGIEDDRLSAHVPLFFIDEAHVFISHCFLDKRTDIKEKDELYGPYQVIYNEFHQLYNADKNRLRSKGGLKNGLARRDVVSYAKQIGESRKQTVVDALHAVYQKVQTPLY